MKKIMKRLAIVLAPWLFTMWGIQTVFYTKEYPISSILFLTLTIGGMFICVLHLQWIESGRK